MASAALMVSRADSDILMVKIFADVSYGWLFDVKLIAVRFFSCWL